MIPNKIKMIVNTMINLIEIVILIHGKKQQVNKDNTIGKYNLELVYQT